MAANLPELYKNNVGPVGYRQEKERDVLYTALMPLKSEVTKTNLLNHACTTGFHSVHKCEIFSTNDKTCFTNYKW